MNKRSGKIELLLLFLILLLASFLRFYRLKDFQFFTYDQARDALIIKRIIVDKKLTLLGPTILIPGFNLPPFYYYLMAPILLLGKLNPLALDIATTFSGVIFVLAIWRIANQFFGKPAGLFSAFLVAVSPIMVDLSRRAWNPNPIPLLALVFVYLVYRFIKEKRTFFLITSSLLFGFSFSFHYSVVCFLPVILYAFWREKRISSVFISVLLIFLLFSPLFLFEFRHNFSLSKSFLSFFAGSQKSGKILSLEGFSRFLFSPFHLAVSVPFGYFQKSAELNEPLAKFYQAAPFTYAPVSIVSHQKQIIFYPILAILIWVLVVFTVFREYKKYRLAMNLFLGCLLSGFLISLIYPGDFHFYFYDFLFPIPFLFLGLFFKSLWQKKSLRIGGLLLIALVGIINISFSLKQEASDPKVDQIIQVAKTVSNDVGENSFNLAVNHRYSDRWDRNAVEYRYFTEAYFGAKPLGDAPNDYTEAKILYFVDENGTSKVLDAKIMEVESFRPKKIIKTWNFEGIKIYKLSK